VTKVKHKQTEHHRISHHSPAVILAIVHNTRSAGLTYHYA